MKLRWFVAAVLAAGVMACGNQETTTAIRFPYQWLDTPGFGGDIDRQRLPEPSGICFHSARGTLFVVSDEGWVTEMTTEGEPLSLVAVEGDLEGITVDPATGLLYIIAEGEDVILEFDADSGQVTRRFPIDRLFGEDPNFLQKQEVEFDNGCESIAFIPNEDHPEGGSFVVANQWDPPCLVEIEAPLRSGRDGLEARILRVLPFSFDDPAGMYFDAQTGTLNVVSDADNIFAELDREGNLIREYAFLGDNQEGIAVDDEGYLYIAQDSGGILKVKDLRMPPKGR